MENQKTVYLLGAGASNASDFELPLMKGFFREEDFKNGNYPNLSEFIKEHFQKIPFCELNLEDVITFLELSTDKFGSFGKIPETYLYEARREFEEYVKNRLNISGTKGCKKHAEFLRCLAGCDSKDSIITLNYDLVVDRTLYGLSPRDDQSKIAHECLIDRMYHLLGRTQLWHGERPSLYHKHKGLGFYLKLHGSVDWLYCQNQDCGNHQLFFPNWIDSPQVHNQSGDPCSLCGSPLVSVIIPPTVHKSFENFPKLGLLWSIAYREIKEADKLVFIGLSLAESDYYLNWLIKSAVVNSKKSKIVEVVNKDKTIGEKIEKLIGVAPAPLLGDFDEYIGKIKTTMK